MDPIKSWALVIIGTGAAWYYYSQVKGPSSRKGRSGSVVERSRRDAAKMKQKKDERQSGSDSPHPSTAGVRIESSAKEKVKKRKPTKLAGESAASSAIDPTSIGHSDYAKDEDVDNKEFAKQLAGLKKGTSLAPPFKKANGSGGRTIKAKEARLAAGRNNLDGFSPASSTTGADGDDDLSPTVSPALQATEKTNPSVSGDISDMLEPVAPGPSVLRITQPTEPVHQQTRRQAPPETQETKKQRQNRKKSEEKKAARQDVEKERRVLLEKQLRTAREAEGRPAKNGLAPAKSPSASPWAAPSKPLNGDSSSHNPASVYNAPLLDTFDRKESETTRPTESAKSWGRELPSEEEQMRILAETDDSSWSTVNKKSKKKGNAVGGTTVISAEEGEATQPTLSSSNPFSQAQDSDWVA